MTTTAIVGLEPVIVLKRMTVNTFEPLGERTGVLHNGSTATSTTPSTCSLARRNGYLPFRDTQRSGDGANTVTMRLRNGRSSLARMTLGSRAG